MPSSKLVLKGLPSWLNSIALYNLGRLLSRDVMWSIFDMFHRPLGSYCRYSAAQLVNGTLERKQTKQNITTERTPQSVHRMTCHQTPDRSSNYASIKRNIWGGDDIGNQFVALPEVGFNAGVAHGCVVVMSVYVLVLVLVLHCSHTDAHLSSPWWSLFISQSVRSKPTPPLGSCTVSRALLQSQQ